MKKKLTAVALIVALLAVAVIGGSLAYFTDETDTAVNTFTVGKVKIDLDEAKVNENGEPVKGENVVQDPKDADRVIENTYDLMPGLTYTKDPTVTVEKGSRECYVRAFVTLTNADKFMEVYRAHGMTIDKALEFFGDYDPAVWEAQNLNASAFDGTTITVEFRYVGPKSTDGVIARDDANDTVLEPIITSVTLPNWVTNEDAAKFPDGFQVNVVAQAIQTAGFDDADAAWAAFDAEP